MKDDSLDTIYHNTPHEHRFMIALIISELILIAVFRLWPSTGFESQKPAEYISQQEIFIEQPINTKQSASPASPPKPQVPVPVPNDRVIEEQIEMPEFDDIFSDSPISDNNSRGLMGDANQIVGSPDSNPKIIRIVEPEVPEAAKSQNIKAEIYVTFLVQRDGKVEEAFIAEIRKYNGEEYEVVQDIGYGLIAATLEAAGKWIFRPAQHNGENVRSYTTHAFSFGF